MDIDILDYLDKSSIVFDIKQKNKKLIISSMLDFLIEKKKIGSDKKKEIQKVLLQREEMGSTAIGGHIALPHARISSIDTILICFAISSTGVNFDSLDQEPVNIIALLISNQKEAGLHLKMLAFLARILRDKYFVQRLKNAQTEEEVLTLVAKQQHAVR